MSDTKWPLNLTDRQTDGQMDGKSSKVNLRQTNTSLSPKDLDYFCSDTVLPLVLDLQWTDLGEIRFKNSQIKMVAREKYGKMFL